MLRRWISWFADQLPYSAYGKNFLLTILRLATEREELKVVDDQVGAPTCAFHLAQATTEILTGILVRTKREFISPEVSGTYHMTAAGQTTWHEFAKAILEETDRSPQSLPWFASATKGRPLIARRVLPISTQEFRSSTRRPAYSVLSNARLMQAFGVTLPDWRAQLHRCFSPQSIPASR